MWSANFIVGASMTMVIPFLSLYIESFGKYSDAFIQRWAGLVFGVTFITAFIFSPLWGKIGDRYGFKPILLYTGYGIALSIFLMGLARDVYTLFFLRLFMGIVTGFIPTSTALISKQTPKEEIGKTLGTLQTGNISGSLFGPIIGGLMADAFGFEYTFTLTAIGVATAATIVLFGIKEIKQPQQAQKAKRHNSKDVLRLIFSRRRLIMVMVIALIIQVGNFSIQPLLALYVSDLTTSSSVAFLSGLAFSATGLGNLLLTRQWGKLGDSIGYDKVLRILLVACTILIIPQGFVTELWQFVLLRFMYGMASGGMLPSITAHIRLEAPLEMQGEVLGYNQSFRFLGNVIGPMLGGTIAGFGGINTVFITTGTLFLCGFGILSWSMKQGQDKKELKKVVNS